MKLRYSEILPENSGGGVSLGSFGVRSAGGCWRSASRAARRALAVASCSANCCKSSRLGSGVAGVSVSSFRGLWLETGKELTLEEPSSMAGSVTRLPVSKMSFENVRGDTGERRKARVRQGRPKAERTKRNSERMQDQQEEEEQD